MMVHCAVSWTANGSSSVWLSADKNKIEQVLLKDVWSRAEVSGSSWVACVLTEVEVPAQTLNDTDFWVVYELNWEMSTANVYYVCSSWADAAQKIVDDNGLEQSWAKTAWDNRKELFAEANNFDSGMYADKATVL